MKSKYSAMTINERLYVSGLSESFDKAVKLQDIAEVIRILRELDLTDTSIKPILEQMNLPSDCIKSQ